MNLIMIIAVFIERRMEWVLFSELHEFPSIILKVIAFKEVLVIWRKMEKKN